MSTVRFEASWIEKQHTDSSGEWNPDADEYCASYHASREQAERAAIDASKKASASEWIGVTEQEYVRHEWTDKRRWVGDWNGLLQDVSCTDEADS